MNIIKSKIKLFIEQTIAQTIKREKFKRDLFPFLDQTVIEVNNLTELKKLFKWNQDPILDIPNLHDFDYEADLNERRLRDAEAIGATVCNISPRTCLEIGTGHGYSTALIGINSASSDVFTVNILPEELESGAGGVFTTGAYTKDEIGIYYRQRGLKNIHQIYANTATWEPDFEAIDLVFIDGSHDTDFVYNDTLKLLKMMRTGSFILWYNFNPGLIWKYPWIKSVCAGVENLFRDHHLTGRIYHLKDSWVGIYRVP